MATEMQTGTTSNRTRIAFVDDHPTLLRGIAGLFEDNAAFEIVGTGTTADEAVALAETARPDIITLDLSMPGDVFGAMAAISGSHPATRLIVFTAYDNADLAANAIEAGARGFVLKGRPSDDLFDAIEAVHRDQVFISPGIAEKLGAMRQPRSARGSRLSSREREIVDCLLQAMSNKEIARHLGLAEKTIKHYMTNLMAKLKVRSRLEVVLAARSMTEVQPQLPRSPEP